MTAYQDGKEIVKTCQRYIPCQYGPDVFNPWTVEFLLIIPACPLHQVIPFKHPAGISEGMVDGIWCKPWIYSTGFAYQFQQFPRLKKYFPRAVGGKRFQVGFLQSVPQNFTQPDKSIYAFG